MTIEFKLPDIGEGVAEGEIVKWLVREGEVVAEHQPIVEVMTDKATVEIPSPSRGTIAAIRAKPGEVVPVGQVIFSLEPSGKGGASAPAAPPKAPAPAPKAAPAPQPAAAPTRTAVASAPAPAPAKAPSLVSSQPAASGGRTIDFKLPDIGEGVAEGEIVRWLVAEGAEVAEHQSVVEVMTDKATVEVPAPAAGRITALLAKAGEVVPVGKVIFRLEAGAAGAPAAARESLHASAPAAPSTPAPRSAVAPAEGDGNGSVLAVPSARRVARELGIDLRAVRGTGRNGVIRRADVEAFHAGAAEAAPAPSPVQAAAPAARAAAPASGSEQRIPFRGVRRKIAEAMHRSKHTAAHFTVMEEVDVTELTRLRASAKELGAEQGIKVTYMPFIMKATALALARYPQLNGRLDEETQEIVRPSYVNLGIATDTPSGLIVPVVRDVQAKGILQLATELSDLAERTRTGKVRPDELKGSTFSITNAGNIGGVFATPIINFPDIAILGVHRLMKKPGVVESPEGDRIEVRQYMNFSTSVDHRVADGADAARFLMHVKRLLENPGLLAL